MNKWIMMGEVKWFLMWNEILSSNPHLINQKERLEKMLLQIKNIRKEMVFIISSLPKENGYKILLSIIMSICVAFISILPPSTERTNLITGIIKLLDKIDRPEDGEDE